MQQEECPSGAFSLSYDFYTNRLSLRLPCDWSFEDDHHPDLHFYCTSLVEVQDLHCVRCHEPFNPRDTTKPKPCILRSGETLPHTTSVEVAEAHYGVDFPRCNGAPRSNYAPGDCTARRLRPFMHQWIPGEGGGVYFDWRAFPEEQKYHCVRCHLPFIDHNNGDAVCVLPDDQTGRHTTNVEEVAYGPGFDRCDGPPDVCKADHPGIARAYARRAA